MRLFGGTTPEQPALQSSPRLAAFKTHATETTPRWLFVIFCTDGPTSLCALTYLVVPRCQNIFNDCVLDGFQCSNYFTVNDGCPALSIGDPVGNRPLEDVKKYTTEDWKLLGRQVALAFGLGSSFLLLSFFKGRGHSRTPSSMLSTMLYSDATQKTLPGITSEVSLPPCLPARLACRPAGLACFARGASVQVRRARALQRHHGRAVPRLQDLARGHSHGARLGRTHRGARKRLVDTC